MRNYKYLFIPLLFALVISACSKDRTTAPIDTDNAIHVSTNDESRIQLNYECKSVWNYKDQVSVFADGRNNSCWEFQGLDGDTSGDLLPVVSGEVVPEGQITIIYPYQTEATKEDGKYMVTLPSTQSYEKGSYDRNSNILIGQGTKQDVMMKNVLAWIKIKFQTNAAVKSVTLKGKNNEVLAGDISIDASTLLCEVTASPKKSVKIVTNSQIGGNFDETIEFYFAVVPQLFSNGFSIDIEFTDGSTYHKETSKAIDLKRNNIAQFDSFSVAVFGTEMFDTTVADKANMTLRGMVYCENKGVPNVLVTDGVTITKTDANGHYWINSKKEYGQVYLILPSGYNVPTVKALPQFWKRTSNTSEHEQHNFVLEKVDNDSHTMLVVTDIHIYNGTQYPKDLYQFRNGIIGEFIRTYSGQQNVYCMNLGDFAWDRYWYSNWTGENVHKNALEQVQDIPLQYWSTMGNHDNDGHAGCDTKANYSFGTQGYWDKDLAASAPFRRNVGPTHVAMNIGKVHYMLIDDINYENTYPGSTSDDLNLGQRNYHAGFRPDVLEWIKADLSYLDKSTPLLIGMHIPLCNASGTSRNSEFYESQWTEFLNLFSGFTEVNFVVGHTHVNRMRRIPGYGSNYYEHNIGAVSGIWWGTSRGSGADGSSTNATPGKLNLCSDGVPSGYMIYRAEGTKRTWRYKGEAVNNVDIPETKQFKAYDMNEIGKFFQNYTPAKNFIEAISTTGIPNSSSSGSATLKATKASYGAETAANTIWINVWGFEKGTFASYGNWSVKVTENGVTTDITQNCNDSSKSANPIEGYHDPIAALTYDIFRYEISGKIASTSQSRSGSNHIFRYIASSPTSTLLITVTDRFGRTYEEQMIRPKVFYNGNIMDSYNLD